MLLKYDDIREITDYPEKDGIYYVIEVNTKNDAVVEIIRREFTTFDDDHASMFSGWEDIQVFIDNPEIYGRTASSMKYYWCEELKLK